MRSNGPVPVAPSSLASTLACLSGLLMAASASAETASEESSVPTEAVNEVVVTAQRRAERLNDVPITISAFSGDALRESGAINLEELASKVSNAQLFENNGSGMPVWVIRGVGVVDFNTNNTPASAVYVDDIYQVSSVFGTIGLYDIERVEVLKGPQGGLYGRNTSGGAVRVITRAPDLQKTTGEADATFGRWGRFKSDIGASFPLIPDKLAVRLSGRIQKSSGGWQDLPQHDNYGKWDAYALRGQMLFKPHDAFDVRLIVDTGTDNSEFVIPRSLGMYAAPATPGAYPPYCAAVLAGHLDDDTCLTFSQAVSGTGASPGTQAGNATRVLGDPFSRNNNDTVGETVIANLSLGDLTLTSVSGYRDFNYRQMQENDAIQGEWGHQISGSYFQSYSQEFRLASAADRRLTWIVGASYGRDDLKERRAFPSRDNAYFVPLFGSPLIFRLFYDQKTVSWAGFGQADYKLTDTVTLSGALRYTNEEKDYSAGGIGIPSNGIIVPATPDNFFATPLSGNYRLADHWSGKVSVSWKPIEDSLLYASISKGFKVGGFFGGFAFAGQHAIEPYKEETVRAYEIGSKNEFRGGRAGANVAVFYYDYQDVQSFATEEDPFFVVITRLRNVGDARHIGAELDGFVVPTRGLRLEGSVGYLDAKIQNSPNNFFSAAGELLTYNGLRRFYAPEWSWTAQASYELPMRSGGSMRFAVDANGRTSLIDSGRVLATGEQSLVDRAYQHTPGYTLVNGRISYRPSSGSWEVAAYGRNLLSEVYTTTWGGDGDGSFFQIYGEPLSYGIEASMRW